MSSTYRVLKPYPVFNAVTASTDLYSENTDVSGLLQLEYDIYWSGGASLNGTITVEVLQEKPVENNPSTWIWQTLDLGATVTISGTDGIHNILFTEVPFNLIRLKYTRTAGTCALTATIKGKGW